MAATKTTSCRFSPSLHSQSHLHRRPVNSLLCSDFFKPFFASKPNPTVLITLSSFSSRSSLSRTKTIAPKRSCKALAISGFENSNSETDPESKPSDLNNEATIDLKLPRRRLLVQFTCDLCGERTQRLVNPLAYERGLIYVQCAGCLQHHKLVDNLGLVVEYDLREEINADITEDGV